MFFRRRLPQCTLRRRPLLVVLLALVGTGGLCCSTDDRAVTAPDNQALPVAALFPQGVVVLVGPLAEIELGARRSVVEARAPALMRRDGLGTRDFGGATFSVELDRADRVMEARVTLPSRGLREAIEAAWGPAARQEGNLALWTAPDAGLLMSYLEPVTAGGKAVLSFRRYTPAQRVLGFTTPFGTGKAPLLGAPRHQIATDYALSRTGATALHATGQLRMPGTELDLRGAELVVDLQFSGEGLEDRVIGYELKLRVGGEQGRTELRQLLEARYGAPRTGDDGVLVFSDAPLLTAQAGRSSWHLVVEQRKALDTLLVEAGPHLPGPAHALAIGMSEEDARAAAPELFAAPGGYRPPELERVQLKARFGGTPRRLQQFYLYAPYDELRAALTRAWGAPRETVDGTGELLLWWHAPDKRLRCSMRHGVHDAELELTAYLPLSRVVAALPDGLGLGPSPVLAMRRGALEAALADYLVRGESSGSELVLELPPVQVERTPTRASISFEDGVASGFELSLSYLAWPGARGLVLDGLAARFGQPGLRSPSPKLYRHVFPGQLVVDDDRAVSLMRVRVGGARRPD